MPQMVYPQCDVEAFMTQREAQTRKWIRGMARSVGTLINPGPARAVFLGGQFTSCCFDISSQ